MRHNADPKPFVWTKSADHIIEKERRALDKLATIKAGYQPSDSLNLPRCTGIYVVTPPTGLCVLSREHKPRHV